MFELPHLTRSGKHPELIVDGAPFLCVGGELRNSSASDPVHMKTVWAALAESGINSVVAPVGWDQVEPNEGEFDFSVVDALLEGARAAGIRLVLIWFGAFKNATSTYAPSWVRRDPSRFERADRGPSPMRAPLTYPGSMPKPTLSVFSPRLREADARAYEALMRHIALVDEQHTVIIMQVENEVGLLGVSRDRSAVAVEAWQSPVPSALVEAVERHPEGFHDDIVELFREPGTAGASWQDRWGDENLVADEVFMAWGFASYLGELAKRGKSIKGLPAYANAWLGPQPGQDLPGQYPSGGPTARMGGVWRAAAPHLDFLAPDIYTPDSESVMREYASEDNPLFVPEARVITGDAFRAFGSFDAIGYHAFGIDDVRPGSQLFAGFRHLIGMAPQLLDARRAGLIMGFALDQGVDSATAQFGSTTVVVRSAPKTLADVLLDVGVRLPELPSLPDENLPTAHAPSFADSRPFGIVVQTGPLEYLAVGQRAIVDFSREGATVEISSVQELRLEEGELVGGRLLNGDERLVTLDMAGVTAVRITLLEFADPTDG
ncbi:glycoside hydrolase [Pseudoclavibacter sp. AY1F1]|uniref:DUF5597 domain-containing protein n=1 Tax=Pseudoclavibacter sp. AY1F1 TaxID=2080583 RepID=UPI000CE879A5|nr:DUF5597 domain-containing protein [Pseudoclavibacter sp. AY1F1]PPF43304.1 glycoside hydrolase [Pseudoclavibacter sp. AY1F1]